MTQHDHLLDVDQSVKEALVLCDEVGRALECRREVVVDDVIGFHQARVNILDVWAIIQRLPGLRMPGVAQYKVIVHQIGAAVNEQDLLGRHSVQ
ncbi:hypothetical protein D3C87_2010670 [compost metagenome]